LDVRHIALEGPIGVGKSALAERLAARLDATLVLEDTENPFLADFYADRPGAGLQAQLFYLLARHRQQSALRQSDLFSQATICDYMFDRDKIYAYLNLDDNELFIYQRLFDLLARDVPAPDLVIYLQAPTDVLLRRLKEKSRDAETDVFVPDGPYLQELNEAYQHFFFTTPPARCWSSRRPASARGRPTKWWTICCGRWKRWPAARGTTCQEHRAAEQQAAGS
jgi:deoxyadenosine/deoxycytidine kinase